MEIPFFRPSLGEDEIAAVADCLRSGWLTTGPLAARFEARFAEHVGAGHAVAVSSCTAALQLALEALGLRPGQAVLVPTMTFAATAEVVLRQGAVPILVDCDPVTAHLDLDDAAEKLRCLRAGRLPGSVPSGLQAVGILPVHVAGSMLDLDALHAFAAEHGLWLVEDAAHALPAAWRRGPDQPWQWCGGGTAAISCFSFYANKTLTTAEGGMATTDDPRLAERMRRMSLHGIARAADGEPSWDYRITEPGFKLNLSDLAAALGIHQLARAESMRRARQALARGYLSELADVEELELPADDPDRIHAWHLFALRLRLDRLAIDRDAFLRELAALGVGSSVHWRPLHLHPYYAERLGWTPDLLPVATREWTRRLSLPLYPDLREDQHKAVVEALKLLCRRHRSRAGAT